MVFVWKVLKEKLTTQIIFIRNLKLFLNIFFRNFKYLKKQNLFLVTKKKNTVIYRSNLAHFKIKLLI